MTCFRSIFLNLYFLAFTVEIIITSLITPYYLLAIYDLNDSTDNLKDIIDYINYLLTTTNIDDVMHAHGEAVINFKSDCKLCFLITI